MVDLPKFNSFAAVLEFVADKGIDWSHSFVQMKLNQRPDAWVTVYSVDESPYFDFGYLNPKDPRQTLAGTLVLYETCEVIDWSPGRLACIRAKGVGVEQLIDIITAVASEVFGFSHFTIEVSFGDFGRA